MNNQPFEDDSYFSGFHGIRGHLGGLTYQLRDTGFGWGGQTWHQIEPAPTAEAANSSDARMAPPEPYVPGIEVYERHLDECMRHATEALKHESLSPRMRGEVIGLISAVSSYRHAARRAYGQEKSPGVSRETPAPAPLPPEVVLLLERMGADWADGASRDMREERWSLLWKATRALG